MFEQHLTASPARHSTDPWPSTQASEQPVAAGRMTVGAHHRTFRAQSRLYETFSRCIRSPRPSSTSTHHRNREWHISSGCRLLSSTNDTTRSSMCRLRKLANPGSTHDPTDCSTPGQFRAVKLIAPPSRSIVLWALASGEYNGDNCLSAGRRGHLDPVSRSRYVVVGTPSPAARRFSFFLFVHVLTQSLRTCQRCWRPTRPPIGLMEYGSSRRGPLHALNGIRVILIDFWSEGLRYQRLDVAGSSAASSSADVVPAGVVVASTCGSTDESAPVRQRSHDRPASLG